jgi:tetratricopeptide (TPR) repeat protein
VPDFRARFHLSELLHDQLKELAAAEALQPVADLIQKDEMAKNAVESAGRMPSGVISRMNYFYACHHRHHHEQKDVSKEKQHLEAAIEADPEDADVLIAMYRLTEADDAWKAATKARIEEIVAKWYSQVERLLMEVEIAGNEQTKAATEYALSVECNQYAWLVEIRPNYAGYLDTLGRCYYAKQDLANAVKYQSQAVKLNSYSGQIRRQLELFVSEAKQRGVKLEPESPTPSGGPTIRPKIPDPFEP